MAKLETPATQIIYIITKLELGGAQKVCLSLFKHNSKCFFVSLLCGEGGILSPEAEAIGSVYFIKELKNTLSPKYLFQDLIAFYKIYAYLSAARKLNPNLIVHTHSSKAGILGRMAARLAGCKKNVHTVHGFGFNNEQFFLKFYFIWLVEFFINFISTKLIFVSQADLLYAQKKMFVSAGKSVLIRASVAHVADQIIQKISPDQKSKQIIKIGSVGCFKPQKNLFDLLDAFKILKDRFDSKKLNLNLMLEIVGDGEQRNDIEAWIEQKGLSKNIILAGWVKDLRSFYEEIDIFAMSSLWEGLPCAIVEAQLFQIPVVAYNVGGIQEIIIDGKNGFLIEPKNKLSLSRKLEILACNKSLRNQMRANSHMPTDFSLGVMLRKHQALYKSLIL